MAIVALQPVQLFAPNSVEEQIGAQLCLRSMTHFAQVLGHGGLGLSYNSCNAAVALASHAQYDPVSLNAGAQLFSVLYGSSRLYAGLDADFTAVHGFAAPNRPFSSSHLGEHAEQSAIRTAAGLGLGFYNYNGNNHIYIDLTPCHNCHQWLTNRGENWYVHYFAPLAHQGIAVKRKKDERKDLFGRIMEPQPSKKVKV
ncbi:MAG TPA: hypothetical protein VE913_01595 [Longimicrobium sp.]|nr:hypothetical protein [Longimicrobium sp.]